MSRANIYSLLAPLSPNVGGLIWSDQNGPRPAKPYATVTVRVADPFPPVWLPPDAEGISQVRQMARLAVEWQFIGLNAIEVAQLAALRLRSETQADRAKVLGIGVSNVANATSVPTVLNQIQIEERATVELVLYDTNFVADEVGLIEQVETTGTIDGVEVCNQVISKGV